MGSLISLLLAAGPTVIRMIGDRFGSTGKEVADIAADTVEKLKGRAPAQQEAEVRLMLKNMTMEQRATLADLEVSLASIEAEREKNRLEHNASIYHDEQETHRSEAEHGTDYVKETRPKIARQSAAACFIYVLLFELLEALARISDKQFDGADWQIATALLTPCLGYMGMRTVDAFSKWKTAPSSFSIGRY